MRGEFDIKIAKIRFWVGASSLRPPAPPTALPPIPSLGRTPIPLLQIRNPHLSYP